MSLIDGSAKLRHSTSSARPPRRRSLEWTGVLAALCLAAGSAAAVTISPVIVELSPAHKIVSVTVTNPSDDKVSFQADILAWSQPNGQDQFAESDDLLVVPPIADIAAGASQIFRVTSRMPPGAREQAYRLILEDVTPETAGPANSATVNVRVRHSLPVFVAAEGKPVIAVRVASCPAPAAKGCVRLHNDGGRYVAAKLLTIDSAGWHKEVPVAARVLAGSWREWRFDLPASAAGPFNVKADTSVGTVAGELPTLSR